MSESMLTERNVNNYTPAAGAVGSSAVFSSSGSSCRLNPSLRISTSVVAPAATVSQSTPATTSAPGRRQTKRSTYKHIPHREKPAHLVARRNARERRRVQAVNGAFIRLRRHIPYGNKNKRLSKVKTLRIAIDYINHLKMMLEEHDSVSCSSKQNSMQPLPTYKLHHPQQQQQPPQQQQHQPNRNNHRRPVVSDNLPISISSPAALSTNSWTHAPNKYNMNWINGNK